MTTYTIALSILWTLINVPIVFANTPTADNMTMDAVLGRPAAAAASVVGFTTYLLTLPFSLIGGNSQQAQQRLVTEPVYDLFGRCLGV